MKSVTLIFSLCIGCYGMNKSSLLEQSIHDHVKDTRHYRKGGRIEVATLFGRISSNRAQLKSRNDAGQFVQEADTINQKITEKEKQTVAQHPDHRHKPDLEQSIEVLTAQKMEKEKQIKQTKKELSHATQTVSELKRMERDLDKLQTIASVHNKHELLRQRPQDHNALFRLVNKYLALKYDSRIGKGSHRAIIMQDDDGNTLKTTITKGTKGRDMKSWVDDMIEMIQQATMLDIDVYDMPATVRDAKQDARAAEVELSQREEEARLIKHKIRKMQEKIGEIKKYESKIEQFEAELNVLEVEKMQLEEKAFAYLMDLTMNQHDGLFVNYLLTKFEPKRQQMQKELRVLNKLNDTKYDERMMALLKEFNDFDNEMIQWIITEHNITCQTIEDVQVMLFSLRNNYQFIGHNHVAIACQCQNMKEKELVFMMSMGFEEYHKFFCYYKTVFDFAVGLFEMQISRVKQADTNMTARQSVIEIRGRWSLVLGPLMYASMLHTFDILPTVGNMTKLSSLVILLGTRHQMGTMVASSEVQRKMQLWSSTKLEAESTKARKYTKITQDQTEGILVLVQFLKEYEIPLKVYLHYSANIWI
eukprot:70201_1